jgi:hypothetical protein
VQSPSSSQHQYQPGLPLSQDGGRAPAGYAYPDLADVGMQKARGCLLGAGLMPSAIKEILSKASHMTMAALESVNAETRLAAVLEQSYESGKARSGAIVNLAEDLCQAAAKGAAAALAGTVISGRKKLRAEFAEAVRHGVRDKVRALIR